MGGRTCVKAGLETTQRAADFAMVADQDKRQAVVLKLKQRAGIKADADFPVALLQPL